MSRAGRRARRAVGRGLLVWAGLELALRFVPLPPWWEAGVWDGNILSDRAWVALHALATGEHNLQGYRAPPPTPPGGRPRLVALGDSRVYGHHVRKDDAFPQQMNGLGPWEAVNLGLPGASVVEALDFIADDALALRPQAAVVCYDVNSSLYGLMSREAGGRRGDLGLQLLRSSAVARWAELGARAALGARGPVMPEQRYEDLLVDLLEKLQAGGVGRRIVLVGWTELSDYPGLFTRERYEGFRAASRRAAARAGAGVVEMEAVFSEQHASEVFVGDERLHLSPPAHRRLAEALLAALGPP